MSRHVISVVAIVLLINCQNLAAQSIELTVDQSQSNVTLTIEDNSDSSSITGTGTIELMPQTEPIDTARVTDLNLVIEDGFTIDFLFGLVSVSAEPAATSVFMITPGPAAPVNIDNQFDQTGNLVGLSGVVNIFDPLMLAGGSTDIVLDDIGAVSFDIQGAQLTIENDMLTVSSSLNLDVPATDTINVNVNGVVVLTGEIDTSILLGDVNCDGKINLLDVTPFVELVVNGQFLDKADINNDLAVDLLDVSPFVALIVGN